MPRYALAANDERGPPPRTFKRTRFADPPSLWHRSVHPSQSSAAAAAAPEDDDDDEDGDFVPIEDVESDSQDSDEDDDDDDDEETGAEPVSETETETERLGHQQQVTSSDVVGAVSDGRSLTDLPEFNNGNGALQAWFTDPDILDCPICLVALCAPVFQCENGHIACSLCCSKVNGKCPCCCMPIGYNRCRALEKIVESVKVPCRYAPYGCTEITLYGNKSKHEQMCPHITCYCPHPTCSSVGSAKMVYHHFATRHAAAITTRFIYDACFLVNVTTDQTHFFLQEQEENVIFILNQEVREHDRAFSIDCVGPRMANTCFMYQLVAFDIDGTLKLQCITEMYTNWSQHALRKKYLAVPNDDFLLNNGTLSLQVSIKKDTPLL